MTIGQGWALVKEIRRVQLVPGTQDLVLEDIPIEADLSSLQIRSRRYFITLEDWHREGIELETERRELDYGRISFTESGDLDWHPGRAFPAEGPVAMAAGQGPVICRIRHHHSGEKAIEVSYLIRGFSWGAHYALLIRGDVQRDEKVSVDLDGFINITNPSSRSFANALVHLVGYEYEQQEQEREPGILLFKETPLADFWKLPESSAQVEYAFRLPKRVNIARRNKIDVLMVETKRIPARQKYFLNSAVFKAGLTRPLQRLLVIDNSIDNALGWRLPPGRVAVFQGSLRNQMLQTVQMAFTDVNDEIRINMGVEENVRATRSPQGQYSNSAGSYEASFEVTIQNLFDFPVRVDIQEHPPTRFEWSVVRSTEPYVKKEKELIFTPLVEELDELQVKYRIRYRRPVL